MNYLTWNKLRWNKLRYKPNKIKGEWGVTWYEPRCKKDLNALGYTYTEDVHITVQLHEDYIHLISIGDELANGVVLGVGDRVAVVKRTPEEQAICKSASLNYQYYRRLALASLELMTDPKCDIVYDD